MDIGSLLQKLALYLVLFWHIYTSNAKQCAHNSISACDFCQDLWTFAGFQTFGRKWACLIMKKEKFDTYWLTLLNSDPKRGKVNLLKKQKIHGLLSFSPFLVEEINCFVVTSVLQNPIKYSFIRNFLGLIYFYPTWIHVVVFLWSHIVLFSLKQFRWGNIFFFWSPNDSMHREMHTLTPVVWGNRFKSRTRGCLMPIYSTMSYLSTVQYAAPAGPLSWDEQIRHLTLRSPLPRYNLPTYLTVQYFPNANIKAPHKMFCFSNHSLILLYWTYI